MRNQLAHGNISFLTATRAADPDQLGRLQQVIISYMRAVTASFGAYLDGQQFLSAEPA